MSSSSSSASAHRTIDTMTERQLHSTPSPWTAWPRRFVEQMTTRRSDRRDGLYRWSMVRGENRNWRRSRRLERRYDRNRSGSPRKSRRTFEPPARRETESRRRSSRHRYEYESRRAERRRRDNDSRERRRRDDDRAHHRHRSRAKQTTERQPEHSANPIPIVEPTDVPDQKCCTICLHKEKTLACMPCGHLCLCMECAGKLVYRRCPICNTNAKVFTRIYF